jgi:hypothetical protein
MSELPEEFTYLFYDLMSGVRLAEIAAKNVSFGAVLDGVGSLQGKLNMASPIVQKQLGQLGGTFGSSTNTAKTAVYVDLNGVLMWGGILWTATYNSVSKEATLGAQDFWSYFANRRINWDADFTASGSGPMDQLSIFEQLILTAQSEPGGDLGVLVDGVLSGQQVSIKWDPSQVIPISQAVTSLAQQSGVRGFDYAIDVAYDSSGVPQKYLTLSYPRRGRIAGTTGLVFDCGNKWARGYEWPEDGSIAANVVYGIGAGSGPATAANQGGLRTAQAFPTSWNEGGYPLLEGVLQRSDVTDQATLDALTITNLAAVAYPVVLPSATFALGMPDPQFGSYICGDDAALIIPPDDWFPAGLEEFWRIVGWTVNVEDEGVNTVRLDFAAPPLVL